MTAYYETHEPGISKLKQRLFDDIERLAKERDLWKERHDREHAAHEANLREQQKLEAHLQALLHGGDCK